MRGLAVLNDPAFVEQGGMPAGAVLSVGEMHADAQTRAREMVVPVDHPVAGQVETLGLPVKFSTTPGAVRGPAPLLGQHTREVLGELGYAETEIGRMLESGAAMQAEFDTGKSPPADG